MRGEGGRRAGEGLDQGSVGSAGLDCPAGQYRQSSVFGGEAGLAQQPCLSDAGLACDENALTAA
jgi:hypothetical protein